MFTSLSSGSRFGTLYRTGARSHSGGIRAFQAPGESVTPVVGIVAGKKVGNAVDRNRAKRRLREAIRRVPLSPHTTYVFVASNDVVNVPFLTLVRWLDEAVRYGATRSEDD